MYWVTEKAWAACKEEKVVSQKMKSAKGCLVVQSEKHLLRFLVV